MSPVAKAVVIRNGVVKVQVFVLPSLLSFMLLILDHFFLEFYSTVFLLSNKSSRCDCAVLVRRFEFVAVF